MANPQQVVVLHEREARIFPRDRLFDLAGASRILSATRALSAIDLRDVADGIELRALGLIGYLPLTSEIVLNIQPKFPLSNLWEMLSVADETYERILPVLRSYEIANVSAPHLLLARSFCHYLRQILSLGIARGYYAESLHGHYRPKVNFGLTFGTYLSRGNQVNVVADAFLFSADLLPNRLIRSACLDFIRIIPRTSDWLHDRRLMMEALSALDRVKTVRMNADDQESAMSMLPAWLKPAYRGALSVYAVQCGFAQVGFAHTEHGRTMPSFLFSLDRVFESFVRNAFQKADQNHQFTTVDGNLPRYQLPLFSDTKRFLIKPDLIFRHDRKAVAIGEVKYKPKISENDRYQLISHVLASKARSGIWISPATEGEEGLELVGKIATGESFYHYRLNISSDIKQSLSTMVAKIAELVNEGLPAPA